MVDTIKFSQMTPGGDLSNSSKTPGLLASSNVLFDNPWTFLAPGTTAGRPPISPDIYYRLRLNTSLQAYEYYNPVTTIWTAVGGGLPVTGQGTQNQVLVNGTFGISQSGALTFTLSSTLNLPGTFNIQSSTAVNGIINDSTLGTATSTNLATALSIKNYIDTAIAGFNFLTPAQLATTAALTATYINGASGIGATLTNSGAQAALTIDGVAAAVGYVILVKNQASTFQNGLYTVTNIGSGATNWVLTRATFFDTPAEIQPGDLATALLGTVNAQTLWLQTATVNTVGTDPVLFVAFGAAFSNVVTISGAQTITGNKTFSGVNSMGNFNFNANQMQHLGDLDNYFEFGTDTQNFVANNVSQMDLTSAGLRLGAANSRVTTILNDGTMAANSATSLATQQSIKTYVDASPGRLRSFQIFTTGAAATYTKPAGITSILVEVIGGGGGGGGMVGAAASASGAGGGGSGGYARLWIPAAAASYTYTVGALGAGGPAGNNNGSAGGTTSFGPSLQATAGGGGQGSPAISSGAINFVTGGTAGLGSNGNINSGGESGSFGGAVQGNVISGQGGSSIYGGGARATSPTIGQPYGSGGCGATGATVSNAGSDGSSGLIVVWEFS